MLHTMLFTIIVLELPSSARGAVSLESPREVYAKLSWPTWSSAIPEEWTLFFPLNSRYIPIHDRREENGDLERGVEENGELEGREDLRI